MDMLTSLLLLVSILTFGNGTIAAAVDKEHGHFGMTARVDTDIPLPESIESVFAIIRSVEDLPVCSKVATAALITSCAGMTTDPETTVDNYIEQANTVYAARLAVCELVDASVTIPSECNDFVPTRKTTGKRSVYSWLRPDGPSEPITHYQDYEEVTEKSLQSCTKALGAKPQFWTSYSNSRQNAVVMCHAMAASVQKDDILNLHRMMDSVSVKANEALAKSAEGFKAFVAKFDNLRDSMMDFSKALMKDMDYFGHKLEQILDMTQVKVDSVNNNLDTTLQLAQLYATILEESQQKTQESVDNLGTGLEVARSQTAEYNMEIREAMTAQMAALSEHVVNLRDSINDLANRTVLVNNSVTELRDNLSKLPTPGSIAHALEDWAMTKLYAMTPTLMFFSINFCFALLLTTHRTGLTYHGAVLASTGYALIVCYISAFVQAGIVAVCTSIMVAAANAAAEPINAMLKRDDLAEPNEPPINVNPAAWVWALVASLVGGPMIIVIIWMLRDKIIKASCVVYARVHARVTRPRTIRHDGFEMLTGTAPSTANSTVNVTDYAPGSPAGASVTMPAPVHTAPVHSDTVHIAPVLQTRPNGLNDPKYWADKKRKSMAKRGILDVGQEVSF